jgi:hypothetical protein
MYLWYQFISIDDINICERTCEESHVEISTYKAKSVEIVRLCLINLYEPLDIAEHVAKVEQNVLNDVSLHSEVYGVLLIVFSFC